MKSLLNIYILICIMLFIFNIAFIILKSRNNNKIISRRKRKNNGLILDIKKCDSINELDIELKEKISKQIEKTNYLLELISDIENNGRKISEKILKELREMVFAQKTIYLKKKEMEKAYFPYALSIFDYSDRKFDIYEKRSIIDFLDCKSLYTLSNTMDLIYKISDLELLEMALEQLNKTDVFYHKKLLVDGMLSCTVSKEKLKNSIEKNFFLYNPSIQEGLIDFCRMKNIDISNLCMDILKREKNIDKEVRYSTMRYFINNRYLEEKYYFLNILMNKESYWIEKMLSIQVLEKYEDICTYELIKEHITDRNWYVRRAAIKYIHEKNINQYDILSILKLKDRYANEALLYEYREEDDMLRYIKDNIRKLEKEQKKENGGV